MCVSGGVPGAPPPTGKIEMRLEDLPTPALLLDADRLESNLSGMATRARDLGVRLRPHLKTHKCVEIAERQRALGARGVTVSTLYEAQVFADHEFHDITWAFPLILSRLDETQALARRVTLRVTVDSVEAVQALEATRDAFHVWLKIDCGYHRAGLDPGRPETADLARRIAGSSTLKLDGLLTHSGHAYHEPTVEGRRRVAEEERRAVADLRARLANEGIAVEASVGSTPGMTAVTSLEGVTEARPGNYAFYDGMQVMLGTCRPEDVAVSVLSTVVSAPAGMDHVVIDAGALALSKDTGGTTPTHYGTVESLDGRQLPDAVVSSVSQEHGMVTARLTVGDRVRVIPNHSCLTVACHDEYAVIQGQQVVDRWKIWRGR
jgi:D-serine deaminase-like pyridoxal phosphate-dependent protein